MGKSSPSPPPAPDYVGQAKQQGEANLEAARLTSRLNRPDEITPFGNRTWEDLGDDRYRLTTTLDPAQENIRNSLYGLGEGQLGRVGEAVNTPFDMSNLPNVPGSVDWQTSLGNLPRLPGVDDFGAERQRVSDTLYQQATRQMDPQWQQAEEAMKTQLYNSGIREGSEAWNNEWQRLNASKEQAYADARDRAILAGGQEQTRLFNLALPARQEEMRAALTGVNLANAALGQNQALAAAARDRALKEASFLRNLPLNELSALLSGQQIQQPGFGGYAQGPQVQPGNFAQAGMLAGDAALQRYNADIAQQNAQQQGMYGLLGTGLTAAALGF